MFFINPTTFKNRSSVCAESLCCGHHITPKESPFAAEYLKASDERIFADPPQASTAVFVFYPAAMKINCVTKPKASYSEKVGTIPQLR
jgi:hypothetical protein